NVNEEYSRRIYMYCIQSNIKATSIFRSTAIDIQPIKAASGLCVVDLQADDFSFKRDSNGLRRVFHFLGTSQADDDLCIIRDGITGLYVHCHHLRRQFDELASK